MTYKLRIRIILSCDKTRVAAFHSNLFFLSSDYNLPLNTSFKIKTIPAIA
jgi:hypothetical protein